MIRQRLAGDDRVALAAEWFHLKRRMLDAVDIGGHGTCRIEHGEGSAISPVARFTVAASTSEVSAQI